MLEAVVFSSARHFIHLQKDMAKFAIVQTGGKQYKVAEGEKISVEKIDGKDGKKVSFKDVLLVADGKTVEVGKPTLSGKKVEGKIVRQFREDKIDVIKYKNKIRYKKKYGHRQPKTEIAIDTIA